MSIFENFEKKLQAEPKSIVFTEGTDARILSAASRLLAGKTLKVILLGELEAVKKAAADGSFDITGAEIIDPANYEGFDEMVAKMVELRKGKAESIGRQLQGFNAHCSSYPQTKIGRYIRYDFRYEWSDGCGRRCICSQQRQAYFQQCFA